MSQDERREHLFFWVIYTGVILLALLSAWGGFSADQILIKTDPDDVMHLLSVRDWVSGQGWFDMSQHRILPPEGLPLHWSRYAMIIPAAILMVLDLFLSPENAELMLAILWPTLLLAIFLLAMGRGAMALFGGYAAGIALLMFFYIPGWGLQHFLIGQMDHHGIQLVLMAITVSALIWPTSPQVSGLTAALAAALSLAIGLETLFFVAGCGLSMITISLMEQGDARAKLRAFCLAFPLFLVVAYLGQTQPEHWTTPACDRLSPPILAIALIGALSGLAGLLAPGNRLISVAAVGICAVVGMGLCANLVGPCVKGPYGALPEEMQRLISERITEARPALAYVTTKPALFLTILLPVLGTAAVSWAARRDAPSLGVLTALLTLLAINLAATFWQVRQSAFFGTVAPMLAGFALVTFFKRLRATPNASNAVLLLWAALFTFFAPRVALVGALFTPEDQAPNTSEQRQAEANCDKPSALEELDAWPAGRVLASINTGAYLIYATHHTALSAPYHRSAKALYNGTEGLSLADDDFQAFLASEQVDYLFLCRDQTYGYPEDTASRIAAGYTPDYLNKLPTENEDILFFSVQK